MSDVKIRIGALHDRRSTDAVLADMTTSMRRATATMNAEARSASKAQTTFAKESAKIRGDAEKALARQNSQMLREWEREAKRASREIARERLRDIQAIERAEAKATRQAQRERERFASRTSQRFTRFLFPRPEGMLGYGRRVGADMMRGLGYDMSMSGAMGRTIANQKAAIALSNQGYIPGQGRFEDRISSASLRGTARGLVDKYGGSEAEYLGGMTRFTDVTGDLKTAQDTSEKIALLAAATGTSFEDASSAAADMSMQLGNMPDKAKRVADLLAVAAMGGKQGAVEMKDLARYVPKLAAAAPSFAGDVGTNITKMLAAAQTARQYGGAASSAQAATSVASMVNTLKTPARVNEFLAHGVKVYGKGGGIRDIQDIIKESIVGSKGKMTEFKKMWANVQGARAVEGFMNIYRQAGGGQKGLAAVDAQFAKFTAALKPEEQAKLAAAAVDQQAVKAERFNMAMEKAADTVVNQLGPAAEKLAPQFIKLATLGGKAAALFTDHWAAGIAAAIVIAIGRAMLEAKLRQGIDRYLAGRPGASPTGMLGGALPGGATGTTTVARRVRSNIGGAALVGITGGLIAGDIIASQIDSRLQSATGIGKSVEGAQGLYGIEAKKKANALREEYAQRMKEQGYGETGMVGVAYKMRRNFGRMFGGTDTEGDLSAMANMIRILDKRAEWTGQTRVGKSFKNDMTQNTLRAEDIGNATANALANHTISARVVNFPAPTGGGGGASDAHVDHSGRQAAAGAR